MPLDPSGLYSASRDLRQLVEHGDLIPDERAGKASGCYRLARPPRLTGPRAPITVKSFPARSAAAGHPQALSGVEEARSALTAAADRGLSDAGDCP